MTKKRPTVVKLRAAVRDLVEIADYLARSTSLADDDPELVEVRPCPVATFKKYLFYDRPIEGGIEVLRVISSDWRTGATS